MYEKVGWNTQEIAAGEAVNNNPLTVKECEREQERQTTRLQ